MPDHVRYEELCALAIVGQISAADSAELQAHLKECATCRKAQADFVELESVWLSPETESEDVGSTLNQRILCKMRGAGARFSKPVLREAAERSGFLFGLRPFQIPSYAIAACVLLAVGSVVGFAIAQRFSDPNSMHLVLAVPAPAKPVMQASTQELHQDTRLTTEELAGKLAAAETKLVRTQAELKEAEGKLDVLQDAKNHGAADVISLRAAVEQARADAANAQMQLLRLKDVQAAQTADLVAAEYRAREAEDKLAEQVATIDRERQLLGAGREIRDIIAARNLHIVDVADVSNSGVKKPFGRVFYTEGKSLVFYAYDLANTKGKQTFTAWGKREGDPNSTRVLGILLNDDQAQKRWAMRFSDPEVLAQIDSVFVTLEPSDKPGSSPKGKKLLNAYLGTPANHP